METESFTAASSDDTKATAIKRSRASLEEAVKRAVSRKVTETINDEMRKQLATMSKKAGSSADGETDRTQPFYFSLCPGVVSEDDTEIVAEQLPVATFFTPQAKCPWTVVWNTLMVQCKARPIEQISVKTVPQEASPQDLFLGGFLCYLLSLAITDYHKQMDFMKTESAVSGFKDAKRCLAAHVDNARWNRKERRMPYGFWSKTPSKLTPVLKEMVASRFEYTEKQKTVTSIAARIHQFMDLAARKWSISMEYLLPTDQEMSEEIITSFSTSKKKITEKGKKGKASFSFIKEEADIYRELRKGIVEFSLDSLSKLRRYLAQNAPVDGLSNLSIAVTRYNNFRAKLSALEDLRVKARPKMEKKPEQREREAFQKKPIVDQLAILANKAKSDNVIVANALKGAIETGIFEALGFDPITSPMTVDKSVEDQVAQLKEHYFVPKVLASANKLANLLATRGQEAKARRDTLA